MTDKDYQLFEQLVSMSQNEMHSAMNKFLRAKYEKVLAHKEFIVAVGDIPIALVAHMDTVFKTPVIDLYYDKEKGVLWSPQGLGADDRAGIFAIIKIIQSGLRPSIILTTDEEKGGVGAIALTEYECPIPGLKYMIELDRRGAMDCVFYDCDTKDFIKYVESFGFKENLGSFSDISFLMSEWNVCGTNLSVGYIDEHSYQEVLYEKYLFRTIDNVKKMLEQEPMPDFEYKQISYNNHINLLGYSDTYKCVNCGIDYTEYELFPVEADDGNIEFYCPDCLNENIEWCEICGEAFIKKDAKRRICKKCEEELCTKMSSSNLDK